jgi:hypothetical protein
MKRAPRGLLDTLMGWIGDDPPVAAPALLCIPRGGLNDTFTQIEQCWRYAEEHGRTLLIDARKSGLLGQFSTFFSIRQASIRVVPLVAPAHYRGLRRLAIRPFVPRGVGRHRSVYSRGKRNFIDRKTGGLLSFDFARGHPEALLLHEQCGGGTLGQGLLQRVALAHPLRAEIGRELARLPRDYVAVHVRNTDYCTDYEPFLASIRPAMAGLDVLVCSDDAAAIARARYVLDRSRVLTVTRTPQTRHRPLHDSSTHRSRAGRRRATIAAITDLLALGGARELHFADVTAGYPSGFSLLARHLNENKELIDALLAR